MDEGFGSRRRYRYSGRGEARVCPSFRLPAFTVKEHSNAFTQNRGQMRAFSCFAPLAGKARERCLRKRVLFPCGISQNQSRRGMQSRIIRRSPLLRSRLVGAIWRGAV